MANFYTKNLAVGEDWNHSYLEDYYNDNTDSLNSDNKWYGSIEQTLSNYGCPQLAQLYTNGQVPEIRVDWTGADKSGDNYSNFEYVYIFNSIAYSESDIIEFYISAIVNNAQYLQPIGIIDIVLDNGKPVDVSIFIQDYPNNSYEPSVIEPSPGSGQIM